MEDGGGAYKMSDTEGDAGKEVKVKQLRLPHKLRLLAALPRIDTLTHDPSFAGYVMTTEHAYLIKKHYEEKTKSRFALWHKTGSFGATDFRSGNHKMHWELPVRKDGVALPFQGVPFLILGNCIFDCQYGKDRNVKRKQIYAAKIQEGEFNFKKRRIRTQPTKKCDCPARIIMKELVVFPEFEIEKNTIKRKVSASSSLRAILQQGDYDSVKCERRIYIALPSPSNHTNHIFREPAGVLQPLDHNLVSKIHELVDDGVRTVTEMRRHLKVYVKRVLFWNDKQPAPTNRRFYPNRRTIEHHILNATIKQRVAKLDQDNVAMLIQKWKSERPNDKTFFRAFQSDGTENMCLPDSCDDSQDDSFVKPVPVCGNNRFLFVHQTPWQSHLLLRYGQEITFMDATYKTSKYALPVFFLVVKTNVDYQIVTSFVVQDETAVAIAEVLSIIKDWNPTWSPRHIMLDLSAEEINAVTSTFPECKVLLSDFHREQAWERWTSMKEHSLDTVREVVMKKMRRIAQARTPRDYISALENLKESNEWNANPRLQHWFTRTWLKHKEKWVWAWREDQLHVFVGINNGIEKQNQAFKNDLHPGICSPSLSFSGMLKVLVEDFLPDSYKKYIDMNTSASSLYKRYQAQVPQFLHGLPPHILQHCLQRLPSVSHVPASNIKVTDDDKNLLQVKSEETGVIYNLYFGSPNQMPRCECMDWQRWYLPCKHLLAVFRHMDDWQWERLPLAYRDSPFLTLDEAVLFLSKRSSDQHYHQQQLQFMDSSASEEVVPEGEFALVGEEQTEDVFMPSKRQMTRCCELLNRIKTLVHEVVDGEVLVDLEESLLSHILDLEHNGRIEGGIHTSHAPTLRARKRKKPPTTAASVPTQPKRLKKKQEQEQEQQQQQQQHLHQQQPQLHPQHHHHHQPPQQLHQPVKQKIQVEVMHVQPAQTTALPPPVPPQHPPPPPTAHCEIMKSDDINWGNMVEVTTSGITVCRLVPEQPDSYVMHHIPEQPGNYVVQQPGSYLVQQHHRT